MSRSFCSFILAGAGAALSLSACAPTKAPPPAAQAEPAKPSAPVCTPVGANDPMVGTWYAVSRAKGVAGEYQSLTVLSADGSMSYETQIKAGRKIRPAFREKGCWRVDDGVYTMQTTVSNGEPVDVSDPIYVNRFQVVKVEAQRLVLRELKPDGQQITARRMGQGYRLPF